jgi:3-hydroxyisobutyrate dehydrogenase
MRIGCIGLGHIGGHLAANLMAAGHEVTVHDLDRRAADSLVAAGASWADSPAATARASDAVVTCLPSVAAATTVVAGDGGLLDGFAPGAVWIEMGTTDPHELARLAALLAERGVDTLEAPVTGGVHNASSGTLTIIVGGEESVFRAHEHVFCAVGGRVFHVGPLGKASSIKVVSNMLAFIHIAASAEAFMLCRRSGIDLRLAWEVLRASSGDSFILGTESTTILSGSYDVGFSFDLCLKDMGLALALGRELDVPLDIAGTVEQLFIRGRARYGGSAEYAKVAKLLEEACDVDLRAPGFPATLEDYLATMPRAANDDGSDSG